MILLSILIGIFIISCIIIFPIALIKVARTKKINCPKCENSVRLIGSPVKCPKCKTKLFKHADGNYRVYD